MSYYLGYDIDSPSTVGGSGSVNAHLRLMTSQLDTIANKTVTIGTVGQGTGNGGSSPWAVSGNLTATLSIPNPLGVSGSVTTLGNGARIKATPTMSGATYTTGMLVGTKLILSGATRIAAGQSVLESVVLSDKSNAAGAVNVVFFETNPSSTTFTDHSTFSVNNTDLLNVVGCVQIATTDYVKFNANAVATKNGLGLEFNSSDTNLYAAIMVGSSSITYASSSDLQLTVSVIQIS